MTLIQTKQCIMNVLSALLNEIPIHGLNLSQTSVHYGQQDSGQMHLRAAVLV